MITKKMYFEHADRSASVIENEIKKFVGDLEKHIDDTILNEVMMHRYPEKIELSLNISTIPTHRTSDILFGIKFLLKNYEKEGFQFKYDDLMSSTCIITIYPPEKELTV